MNKHRSDLHRRDALKLLAALVGSGRAWANTNTTAGAEYSLSFFTEDVSPPLGNPLFNAVRARAIVNPLEAHGMVLSGAGKPIVLAAVDWCEIRNESYERWRSVLAEAAQHQ